MKIGIIGAGYIGGTLARSLVKLGHSVVVANSRGPETLAAFAAESGVTAVSVTEAARSAEVVIVSIPELAVKDLPADLFAGVADNVVVVDTGNYYPQARDGRIPELEESLLDSQWVAQKLGRPVVKAFNNIGFPSLINGGSPPGTPRRIALSVAGDDTAGKEVVLRLFDELGFDGVDTGSLADSWRQQPGTPAYCHDLDREELQRALAAADHNRLKEYRAEADTLAIKMIAELKANQAAGEK